ncbi:Na+/H+ antiporter subunit A [Bacillus fonticola]|uniref:Na+/H+ antiporter subunit A n=1 Tax=Bacillus fonticola TaxID=2728853 RepID=UPI001473177B|nr:Na+/H+ antiporter subunit A [Bacillus fonticola]
MTLLHVAILLPFLFAIFVPLLRKYMPQVHTGWFVLLVPVTLVVYFSQFLEVTGNNEAILESVPWIPALDISFDVYIDGLGLLFALLITGIGALVVLYSVYYLDKHKESLHTFYVYLLLFMGAMLGVTLSDNVIVLYTFWELTSISSFLLIGYWNHKDGSRYGAQKSMLITVFGGLAMLGGFIMLYLMTGTFSIRGMVEQSEVIFAQPLFIPAMLLVLLGAFTKSAQFPFHIWLPDAMEAPTPVSAYLHSATMVKAGIYLVARMSPIFAESGVWLWLVGGVGIVTLFWGSFNAIRQTDLKGILAYSTISQLGLIMSLLGIGAAALQNDGGENIYIAATAAAVFHLINHATFKGSLFMVVGIVDHETGTRDIHRLGGLMTVMPITFTLAMVGSFSMAGLPPFNGFLSKEMFFTGMVNVLEMDFFSLETFGFLFPVLAWIGSIFTFVYSMRLLFKTFTGDLQRDKLEKEPHEAPFGMLISPLILGSLVVIFGFFPNILSINIIRPTMASILPSLITQGETFQVDIFFWHGFTVELFMTLGVITVGTLLYHTYPKWKRVYNVIPKSLELNSFYDSGMHHMQRGALNLTQGVMTGYIRNYLVAMFIFIVGLLAFVLIDTKSWNVTTENTAPIGVYEVILAIVTVVAAITILFAKSRLTSIIALGAVGYAVSLFFVLFRAPDLALTQLVIETVSVALFLLCFYHLPKLGRNEERMRFRFTNAIVSVGVGAIVTIIALVAQSEKLFDSISSYYIENVYEKAAGKNMVNVILVDFRGFDTLFEIAVLSIAAMGIYAMIRLRLARRNEES